MQLKLIELKEDILEQISLILDFGINNKTIEEFYSINKESLNIIYKQISKRIK